jgi:hypothetical protein
VRRSNPRAAVLRSGRQTSQLARTRIFEGSAAVGVESGSKLITSQLLVIGTGRSGAQSSARF